MFNIFKWWTLPIKTKLGWFLIFDNNKNQSDITKYNIQKNLGCSLVFKNDKPKRYNYILENLVHYTGKVLKFNTLKVLPWKDHQQGVIQDGKISKARETHSVLCDNGLYLLIIQLRGRDQVVHGLCARHILIWSMVILFYCLGWEPTNAFLGLQHERESHKFKEIVTALCWWVIVDVLFSLYLLNSS